MTLATNTDMTDLAIGDIVTLKRNLNHPAWKKQVPDDPCNGSDIAFIRVESIDELIGETTIVDRRNIPAVAGWGGRKAKTLVRLANGFWYDLADGYQDGSRATLIELGKG